MSERKRTLKDYRPQHDEDCGCNPVTLFGEYTTTTAVGACSCGLDALLSDPPSSSVESEQPLRVPNTEAGTVADLRADHLAGIESEDK